MENQKETLRKILNKEISAREIIENHLVCFIGRHEPGPDENTTISDELIDEVVTNLRDHSGLFVMGYYDAEANEITSKPTYRICE